MNGHSEFYWMSHLAMTMAQAMKSEDPKRIMRPVLQRIMRDPVSNVIRAQLYSTMQKEETNGRR